MMNADLGATVSNPTPNGSLPQVRPADWIDQNSGITVTYNPSTGACNCNPTSVTISLNNTGTVPVSLGLTSGSTGSIAFSDPPITWSNGAPAGVSVSPATGGGTTVTITDPNSSGGSYAFTADYIYSPASGDSPISGTSDPTIINEGTGTDGDGDDDRH
jgi:hypothetical protein